MTLIDFLRIVGWVEIGIVGALLVIISYVASKVLRPPGGNTTGFLLWHILAISLGLSLVVTVAADALFARLGNESISWQTPVFIAGMGVVIAALVIIFQVEVRRMQRKRKRSE